MYEAVCEHFVCKNLNFGKSHGMIASMEIDTEKIGKFKELLESELKDLEAQLLKVGRINPNNPDDWEPIQGETKTDYADQNERADAITQYEKNTGILKELEIRFNNVKKSLQAIEGGTYGICVEGGEPIALDRLEANPAAQTCKVHMNASIENTEDNKTSTD